MILLVLIVANIVTSVVLVLSAPFVITWNTIRIIKEHKTKKKLEEYFMNILLGQDQVGGSLLYGTVDFTISSWSYFLSKSNKRIYIFMRFIDFMAYKLSLVLTTDKQVQREQKVHCHSSFVTEIREMLEVADISKKIYMNDMRPNLEKEELWKQSVNT